MCHFLFLLIKKDLWILGCLNTSDRAGLNDRRCCTVITIAEYSVISDYVFQVTCQALQARYWKGENTEISFCCKTRMFPRVSHPTLMTHSGNTLSVLHPSTNTVLTSILLYYNTIILFILYYTMLLLCVKNLCFSMQVTLYLAFNILDFTCSNFMYKLVF